jgi:hypothetical protein
VVATVEDPLAVGHILAVQRLTRLLGPGPPGDSSAMAA